MIQTNRTRQYAEAISNIKSIVGFIVEFEDRPIVFTKTKLNNTLEVDSAGLFGSCLVLDCFKEEGPTKFYHPMVMKVASFNFQDILFVWVPVIHSDNPLKMLKLHPF